MRSAITLIIVAALSSAAAAQSSQEHAAHHPPDAAASAPKAAAKRPPTTDAAQMDARMKSMREMHDKMMSAKSAEERQALMADHMKAMQDGMSAMSQMKGQGGRGAPMGGATLGQRMDMMEMMMQMLLDREAARQPTK